MKNKNATSIGWCERCAKHLYITRREARAVARRHGSSHKAVYSCPANDNFWHIGELSPVVISGAVSRDDFYRRAS